MQIDLTDPSYWDVTNAIWDNSRWETNGIIWFGDVIFAPSVDPFWESSSKILSISISLVNLTDHWSGTCPVHHLREAFGEPVDPIKINSTDLLSSGIWEYETREASLIKFNLLEGQTFLVSDLESLAVDMIGGDYWGCDTPSRIEQIVFTLEEEAASCFWQGFIRTVETDC